MDKIIEPDHSQIIFSSLCKEVVLASKSENRRELLEKGGTKVIQIPFDIEEKKEGRSAEDKVMNIAEQKMDAYLKSRKFKKSLIAISADTLVLFEGDLIGKAKTRDEARSAIKRFSGNKQTVITASCLYVPKKGVFHILDEADVYFKKLSDLDIEEYLNTNDWIEAAGSYRLQRNGYKIVEKIEGDWTSVVGLPLKKIISYINSL